MATKPLPRCDMSNDVPWRMPHNFRSEGVQKTVDRYKKFSRALFPRTTNCYGCVTLHSYHFYVEQGLPKTKVLLWVYGEQLRAMFANVVLAEYHCRYDWQDRKVKDVRDGMFYATQFASPQGLLLPLNPQDSLVLYRPNPFTRQARSPFPVEQLWLFELVHTA